MLEISYCIKIRDYWACSVSNQKLLENYTKQNMHNTVEYTYSIVEYTYYILNFTLTNLPGGGCEGLKLARKKGGGGMAL